MAAQARPGTRNPGEQQSFSTRATFHHKQDQHLRHLSPEKCSLRRRGLIINAIGNTFFGLGSPAIPANPNRIARFCNHRHCKVAVQRPNQIESALHHDQSSSCTHRVKLERGLHQLLRSTIVRRQLRDDRILMQLNELAIQMQRRQKR